MTIREKNPPLKALIQDLWTKSPAWNAVARGMNRPRRKAYEVNVYQLETYAKPKDQIVVPGVVLAHGEITKPITVAALKFSKQARDKIEKAGGKCMSLQDMIAKHPDGKAIRIMG